MLRRKRDNDTIDIKKIQRKIHSLMLSYELKAKQIQSQINSGDQNIILKIMEVTNFEQHSKKPIKLSMQHIREYVAQQNDAESWDELMTNTAVLSGHQHELRQYRAVMNKKK